MSRIRGNPENATEAARELRRRGTPAEDVLWKFLRSRQLSGLKFRRQHPLGPYFVDFCCPARRLIVELDGEIHNQQKDQDVVRTEQLEAFGYTVIRFTNADVFHSLDIVLEQIIVAAYQPE